ncbi:MULTISPECIES: phosphoglycerate dehydrogenase [Sinorhizobium]|uniref:D-3-phosphoglycerate dehydrogenase n=2 Tax=Sinorhizobium TaxID=28105 RepID=A0A2S3YG25_9HYPH|nr:MULTISPECIES: phosphoglycerate dehydrogenase [Sinorhizobium]ASY58095.1 D-3-phosphoglycerate dehydrogenase [Sinorhizobium sp. CCBAU 05631]AUX77779.1 D-3-phosphoglycerate dehydrogenase [Sinorhizobium fredii]PDT40095.1 phosphoglycerate dehydrogenase [Sinorhizobium sp. FG01]POH25185.1 phosphoglycerate dehydrogenase [Sinorhizobium americanum]
MAPRVLVSDELSETAVQIFRDRGVEVDFQPKLGKDKEKLAEIIGNYDGLAIRSATKVTEKLIAAAANLKVVGRAGIGVDNVDIPAASRRGIIVMNTPFGNSITTAEHAVALMFAVARQLPAADNSTQAGKWEKSKFMGVEITGKVLGVIGAGNIGSIVCARAIGLKMHVLAYDPFLSKERAEEMGVVKVELDELLAQADFITLHVPLTDKTRNILSAEAIAKTKPGVRIINCARGGLVDEKALADALKSGHVAGAGFDVFEVEPATESPLFGLPNVVCTPHLGASTTEAQENVALQVAEQMADYLVKGAVTNAINMPSITAEEAPILKPFIRLADVLGAFVGQATESAIKEIEILYDGSTATMNTKALTSAVLAGLIRPQVADVNMVSAPIMIKEKGIILSEVKRDKTGVFDGYIKLTVKTANQTRSVAGTVFSDGKPRFIQIKGINLDADVGNHMVYITNTDVPGMIGFIGTTLGDAGVNIANFQLGREKQGGDAIALLYVDGPVSETVLDKLRANAAIRQAKPLVFNVD